MFGLTNFHYCLYLLVKSDLNYSGPVFLIMLNNQVNFSDLCYSPHLPPLPPSPLLLLLSPSLCFFPGLLVIYFYMDPQMVQLFGMLSHFLYVIKSVYTVNLSHVYNSVSNAKRRKFYLTEETSQKHHVLSSIDLKLSSLEPLPIKE